MSDEEFFILREKDIVTVASMSKAITVICTKHLFLVKIFQTKKKSRSQTNVKDAAGYVGKIDEARKMFEKIYKENKSPIVISEPLHGYFTEN